MIKKVNALIVSPNNADRIDIAQALRAKGHDIIQKEGSSCIGVSKLTKATAAIHAKLLPQPNVLIVDSQISTKELSKGKVREIHKDTPVFHIPYTPGKTMNAADFVDSILDTLQIAPPVTAETAIAAVG